MAEGDPTAHVPRRRRYGPHEGETTPAPGNLADRDFTAKSPNEKRPADTTRDQGRGREGRASRRRSTAMTAGSSRAPPVPVPTPGSPTGCPSRPRRRCRRGRSPWCIPTAACHCRWPGWPDLMERYGLIWSTGAKGRSPDNAAAEGFFGRMKTESVHPGHWEERIPRRGTRLGRRLHPLARPRAHQTVARLDEPGTIPPEPGNGCVIISKKTPAAPYPKAYLNMPEIGEIT